MTFPLKQSLSLLSKKEIAALQSKSRLIFNNLPSPSLLTVEEKEKREGDSLSLSPFTVPEKPLSLRYVYVGPF